MEDVGDALSQLQDNTALLVLPTGPKAPVMNPRGLTGPRISRVKKQTWLCPLVLPVCQESVWM